MNDLHAKLQPVIDFLKEKKIADITPETLPDDKEPVLVSFDPDDPNLANTMKLFYLGDSRLLGVHHDKDNQNPKYEEIYKIINDALLMLNGLKIIQISRYNNYTLSILMKRTGSVSGSGGKKKRYIKRRKSTKKKRHIRKKRHTKRR